jgi:hypothetical protein
MLIKKSVENHSLPLTPSYLYLLPSSSPYSSLIPFIFLPVTPLRQNSLGKHGSKPKKFVPTQHRIEIQPKLFFVKWMRSNQGSSFIIHYSSWIWGSHGGDYEECAPVWCSAVQFGKNPMFRKKISPPSSRPGFCLAYSSNLMMEVICSTETLGSLEIVRRYTPEYRTFHRPRI